MAKLALAVLEVCIHLWILDALGNIHPAPGFVFSAFVEREIFPKDIIASSKKIRVLVDNSMGVKELSLGRTTIRTYPEGVGGSLSTNKSSSCSPYRSGNLESETSNIAPQGRKTASKIKGRSDPKEWRPRVRPIRGGLSQQGMLKYKAC
ncbi:hypothetical protein QBC34DRAFT_424667 [Podospora aff. communis PSN243]|uniref:Uncharacterized protein n=1 Tax=Podospora aff. communis PSN243 TaxID=3040156 RepID=A0AAV9GRF2_9PEZI|nr:hypothetical protein QBC34DRAFT_424667 [Podospora aff. communis PSN243]